MVSLGGGNDLQKLFHYKFIWYRIRYQIYQYDGVSPIPMVRHKRLTERYHLRTSVHGKGKKECRRRLCIKRM
jgi:hypothetical protein